VIVMHLAMAVLVFALVGAGTSAAQTPAEAYEKGCAACHRSESAVIRRIPRHDDAARRAWIEAFMAQHPCERDDLKPSIVEYLLERSRR
jgi:cytochrome c553